MATTAQLRTSYPDLVTHVAWPVRCDFSKALPVWFLAGGEIPSERIQLRVHPQARQAFRALAAVMYAYGYRFRERAGGTLSCRVITGGQLSTLHAHGIAGDFNPSLNGYRFTKLGGVIQWGRHTDMPKAMIDDIERIRTADGQPVFNWGGRWVTTKDPMHFQIQKLRASLATGIDLSTVIGWKQYLAFESGDYGGDMIPIDGVTVRPIVFKLQESLNRAAVANGFPTINVDGISGPRTAELASIYRKGAGLEKVGEGVAFDGATIAVLFHLYGG